MELPERVIMTTTVYGDGAKGLAFQISRNEEHGVQCDSKRARHGAPWVDTWTSDYLPHQTFKSFRELLAAVRAAAPAPRRPPIVTGTELKGKGTGRCWLCRGEWARTVIVKTGWRQADIRRIPSCTADLEKVCADPAAAIEARQRHVKEFDLAKGLQA